MERFAKAFSRLAISASVLLIFVAAVAQAQTTPRIVFHSDRDGNPEIYIMDEDGTNVQRLTNDSGDDEYAAFCGTDKIVFSSNRGQYTPKFDIWIMDVDGTNQVNVTDNDSDDHEPDCGGPNNDIIVFRSDRDGIDEIYSIKIGETDLNRLTDNDWPDENPQWCGNNIIFARDLLSNTTPCIGCGVEHKILNPGVDYQIFLMSKFGDTPLNPARALTCATNPHPQITGTCEQENQVCEHSTLGVTLLSYWPSCQDDGRGGQTIVMSAYIPATYTERNIYTFGMCSLGCCISTHGDPDLNLLEGSSAAVDDYPDWSPAGNEITFASKRNGGDWDVFVMDDDGSNVTALTSNSDEDTDPNWGDADD